MKKLFIGIVLLMMVAGCAGLKASTAIDVTTDTAFVLVLQNNPDYKPHVVSTLNIIKVALQLDSITYDDLIQEFNKQLPDKYKVIANILISYIETDKPVFETYLPMLDSYKAGVINKIDRLLTLI